jgi:hypothetical protein
MTRYLIMKRMFSKTVNEKKIKKVIPTMAESFGEKLDKNIGDKYLNPVGFLNERGKI